MLTEKNKNAYSRSLKTRRQLIRATLKLSADKSVDSLTFSDIARLTGFSRGTIYTYFQDVDALISAASQELWRAYRLEIALVFRKLDDPALKVALSIYYFLTQARDDSVFAWFMIRNRMISAHTSTLLHSDMEVILAEGIQLKRFTLRIEEVSAAITLLRGVAILASQNVLSGSSTVEQEQTVIKLTLQALGLSLDEANHIAYHSYLEHLVKDRRITQRLIYA